MAIAIKIDQCVDTVIENCSFSGFDTAIDISDSDGVDISGAKFTNVNTGVKARRVKRMRASNCIEDTDRSGFPFKPSTAASVVRWYVEHLRNRG